MWARRRRGTDPADRDDGVADVEAFLLGESVRYYRQRGEPIPAWAWLNSVAHAEPETLVAMGGSPLPDLGAWRLDATGLQAVSSIALAVRWHAGGNAAAIRTLQRDLLVPLELALMAGRVQAATAQAVAYLARVTLRAGRCPPTAAGATDGHDQPP